MGGHRASERRTRQEAAAFQVGLLEKSRRGAAGRVGVDLGFGSVNGAGGCWGKRLAGQSLSIVWPGVWPLLMGASVFPGEAGVGDSPPLSSDPWGSANKNDCKTLCKQQGCSQRKVSSPQRGFSSLGGPPGALLASEEGALLFPRDLGGCRILRRAWAGPRARCWQPPSSSTRGLCVSPRPGAGAAQTL